MENFIREQTHFAGDKTTGDLDDRFRDFAEELDLWIPIGLKEEARDALQTLFRAVDEELETAIEEAEEEGAESRDDEVKELEERIRELEENE